VTVDIYKDEKLKVKIENNIIHENDLYYIDFSGHGHEFINSEIRKSRLGKFINWHNRNAIGTLRIVNYIGIIKLFGKTYDVRSKKFLEGNTGKEQFEYLLNDLIRLSKDLIFNYSSPALAIRDIDRSEINPSLLMRFNYFKQLILDWPVGYNLPSLFENIFRHPHTNYFSEYHTDYTWKIKKHNHKSLLSLINNNRYYANIDTDHPLSNSPITKFISRNSKNLLFPTKSEVRKEKISYDTQENRFIKYFLKYIEGICTEIDKIEGLSKEVKSDKDKILEFVRNIMRNNIFSEVGNINSIPYSSSVLLNRSGYKEIYSHYIYSRLGIIHLFEDIKNQSLYIDLKDISILYEYWVFYKIASSFLGKSITIEQKKAILKNGTIQHSAAFKNGNISVYFNSAFTRSKGGSYSLNLRPDIFVQIKTDFKDFIFIFDAKYRIRERKLQDDSGEISLIERTFKVEDIHKMHCYLDAIENCDFSIAIYPGDEFYFFEKDIKLPMRKTPSQVSSFEGIGAIPLMPGSKDTDEVFTKFINGVKTFVGN